jgi:hypothetical protein
VDINRLGGIVDTVVAVIVILGIYLPIVILWRSWLRQHGYFTSRKRMLVAWGAVVTLPITLGLCLCNLLLGLLGAQILVVNRPVRHR